MLINLYYILDKKNNEVERDTKTFFSTDSPLSNHLKHTIFWENCKLFNLHYFIKNLSSKSGRFKISLVRYSYTSSTSTIDTAATITIDLNENEYQYGSSKSFLPNKDFALNKHLLVFANLSGEIERIYCKLAIEFVTI